VCQILRKSVGVCKNYSEIKTVSVLLEHSVAVVTLSPCVIQGGSGGPSAIYTLSLPVQQTSTASETVVSETVVTATTTTQHGESSMAASVGDYYGQYGTPTAGGVTVTLCFLM